MKWFKHDSDAKNDVRSKLLISKFGFEGYGIYWAILEFIADDIDEKKDPTSWGTLPEIFTTEFLAVEFRIDEDKLKNILNYMAEIGLIDAQKWNENKIANSKILTRTDEYTCKLRNKQGSAPDKIPTKSRQNPDVLPTKSRARIEQSRVDQNRLEEKKIRLDKNSTPLPLLKENKEIGTLVETFHKKFPEHKKKYSTRGAAKCFDEFEQRLQDGWTSEEILKRINDYHSDNGPPAPWDIFKDPEEVEEDYYPYKKLN